ncbi:MAG: gamma-glutamyl-gamma-aminobutyrate hydrolase family protein [Pseudomonadota bacterium]
MGVPSCRRTIDPHPFHVVGEKYLAALADAGGVLPLAVPALGDGEVLADLFEHIDGLFLTGSYSNVEPHHYGASDSRPGTLHDAHRDATTLPLLTRALEAGIPLFAVCRGFQEVNVALGGTLHQHVQEVAGYIDHRENTSDPLEVQYGPAHAVNFVEGGSLRSIARS